MHEADCMEEMDVLREDVFSLSACNVYIFVSLLSIIIKMIYVNLQRMSL